MVVLLSPLGGGAAFLPPPFQVALLSSAPLEWCCFLRNLCFLGHSWLSPKSQEERESKCECFTFRRRISERHVHSYTCANSFLKKAKKRSQKGAPAPTHPRCQSKIEIQHSTVASPFWAGVLPFCSTMERCCCALLGGAAFTSSLLVGDAAWPHPSLGWCCFPCLCVFCLHFGSGPRCCRTGVRDPSRYPTPTTRDPACIGRMPHALGLNSSWQP